MGFGEDGEIKEVTKAEGIPDGFLGLDCGPKSIELNKAAVDASKTIIWNGPMGVFEMPKFEAGTKALMEAVVGATEKGAVSVIGGGDTATACKKYNTMDKVTHCSTVAVLRWSFWKARFSLVSLPSLMHKKVL